MKRMPLIALVSATAFLVFGCTPSRSGDEDPSRTDGQYVLPQAQRHFEFTYQATATPTEGTKEARLWVPLPQSGPFQDIEASYQVKIGDGPVAPDDARVQEVAAQANRFLQVTSSGEPIHVTLTLEVVRREVLHRDLRGKGSQPMSPQEQQALARELSSNRLIPLSGVIVDRAQQVRGGETNQLNLARLFYDDVLASMRYDKSQPGWGRGDATWACDSGFGNCTDFHSLFIGMARHSGLASRFLMGFPVPPERGEGAVGGYHCWAEFYLPGYGWIPVDISEADKNPDMTQYYFGGLTEDRVAFTVGRDIVLPGQASLTPQNFVIYPVLELDGEPAPSECLHRTFAYRDIE